MTSARSSVSLRSRFARDLIAQETGYRFLRDAGITLIAADSPEAFLDATPTAVMIRQILGSVSQFDKAMLVAKLRGARKRKKAITGKCGGRHSYREQSPEMVALAGKLARYPVNGRKRSLRNIAAELEASGHVSASGKRFGAAAIACMMVPYARNMHRTLVGFLGKLPALPRQLADESPHLDRLG